ncbi:hypothetical protein BDW62DRAFT_36470 [Aspergillus aurantiobrunneus]
MSELTRLRLFGRKVGDRDGKNIPDANEPAAIGIGASSALFEVDGGGLCSGLLPNIGGNGGKDTDETTVVSVGEAVRRGGRKSENTHSMATRVSPREGWLRGCVKERLLDPAVLNDGEGEEEEASKQWMSTGLGYLRLSSSWPRTTTTAFNNAQHEHGWSSWRKSPSNALGSTTSEDKPDLWSSEFAWKRVPAGCSKGQDQRNWRLGRPSRGAPGRPSSSNSSNSQSEWCVCGETRML